MVSKSDEASLDGLAAVAQLFQQMKGSGDNPYLELLGVVLFGIGTSSKRIAARARAAVEQDLGDTDLIFASTIRHVEGPAQDCRRRGQLVHELAQPKGRGYAA